MRQTIHIIAGNVRDWFHDIGENWNRFWFTPADPTLLGLIRILTGTMLLYTHWVWGLQLEAFFGPDAWLSPEFVGQLQTGQAAWSLWWWIPPESIRTAHAVAMVLLACFTLGIATRVTSVLALIVTISYIYRTPAALFGLDQINVLLTLYCVIGPSGSALSVDRLWKRWRKARHSLATGETGFTLRPQPSVGANLALRLIQVHMCVIYFFAGISKLQGAAWWNGEAMWLAFSNLEYQSTDMTWLARHPWLINIMTHTTVLWEISFPALIFRPKWRPVVLLAGIAMHLGIGMFLGMWTFGLIMLVGCASFLPAGLIRGLVDGLLGATRPITLAYDTGCPVCQHVVARWKTFDFADRLRLIDCDEITDHLSEEEPHTQQPPPVREFHVITPGQPPLSGYAARKFLLWSLPPLWPLALLISLPGVAAISRELFERHRRRLIASGTCGVSAIQWREPETTSELPQPEPQIAVPATGKSSSVMPADQ